MVPSPWHAKARPKMPGEFACGVVNKYLTNFEDLRAVYLFGFERRNDNSLCFKEG